jgi:hypothetical protein
VRGGILGLDWICKGNQSEIGVYWSVFQCNMYGWAHLKSDLR